MKILNKSNQLHAYIVIDLTLIKKKKKHISIVIITCGKIIKKILNIFLIFFW